MTEILSFEEIKDKHKLCEYCYMNGENCDSCNCEHAYEIYYSYAMPQRYAEYYHMQKIMRTEPLKFKDWLVEEGFLIG